MPGRAAILGKPASVADKLTIRIVERDHYTPPHESSVAVPQAEVLNCLRQEISLTKIRMFRIEVFEFKIKRCVDDGNAARTSTSGYGCCLSRWWHVLAGWCLTTFAFELPGQAKYFCHFESRFAELFRI